MDYQREDEGTDAVLVRCRQPTRCCQAHPSARTDRNVHGADCDVAPERILEGRQSIIRRP
jgi:hypothetical protein